MALRDIAGIDQLKQTLQTTNQLLEAVLLELKQTNEQRLELLIAEVRELNEHLRGEGQPQVPAVNGSTQPQ